MLNKELILKQLNAIVEPESNQWLEEYKYACHIWDLIKFDIELQENIKKQNFNFVLPTWSQSLNDIFVLDNYKSSYRAISVDGSQIYPDRHSGIPYYLVNIGIVDIIYRNRERKVNLSNVPYVFNSNFNIYSFSEEIVNCQRTELELKTGYELSVSAKEENPEMPVLFLCDGSLIFWHLGNKDEQTKVKYLNSYLNSLEMFYNSRIPIVGYISLPKSCELINVLRSGLASNLIAHTQERDIKSLFMGLVDTDILSASLQVNSRTIVFKNNSPITEYYPDHSKPYFVYIKLENEIARLEFPAWLAQDEILLKKTIEIVIDQIQKGFGYPITLSEAHEQAVVKSGDKDFFYYMIDKISNNSKLLKQRRNISSKSLNKKMAGI